MATDCSSIDLSALVNAAQSAAKDLGYKNPKEQQLEAIVYTNISFHVSKMAVEESLHKCLLLFILKVAFYPQPRQRITAHICDV